MSAKKRKPIPPEMTSVAEQVVPVAAPEVEQLLRKAGIPVGSFETFSKEPWGFRPRGKADPSKDDPKTYVSGPGTGLATWPCRRPPATTIGFQAGPRTSRDFAHKQIPALTVISSATRTVGGRLRRRRRFSLRKIIVIVVLVLAVGAVTAGIAVGAGGDDDDEAPITGTALTRASEAALAHTGGGRVTETEAGDEEGAYEVEVTLDDGSQVDVHLDASFDVIGDEADGNENESGQDDD
jgi:hypothetical protein